MKEIIIKRSDIDEIISHSREAYPEEACGILAGKGNSVERVARMKNLDASRVTYRFDPDEQNRAFRDLQREGLRMVAIYHSHTDSPAYPSQTDIGRAFFPGTTEPNFPETAYVIVSLAQEKPEVRAFMIMEDGVEEISIIQR
jgi:proteasome lid subunit RPN8/RPN11